MENLWSDRMKPYFSGFNVWGDRESMNEVYENSTRSYTKPILYVLSSEKRNMIVDVNIIVPNKV